jgi:hypothetical protein
MKEFNIIDVSQFSKWSDKIISLQNEGKFQEAADLVNEIYLAIDEQELKRDNESEWVMAILDERTIEILSPTV